MIANSLAAGVTGLTTNQFRVDTIGNNLANVNTNEFKSTAVLSSDRGYINNIGQGTQIASTYKNAQPGPLMENSMGGMTEGSNTDPVVELTNMIGAQRAYGVNTATIKTTDEMTQTLLDLKR